MRRGARERAARAAAVRPLSQCTRPSAAIRPRAAPRRSAARAAARPAHSARSPPSASAHARGDASETARPRGRREQPRGRASGRWHVPRAKLAPRSRSTTNRVVAASGGGSATRPAGTRSPDRRGAQRREQLGRDGLELGGEEVDQHQVREHHARHASEPAAVAASEPPRRRGLEASARMCEEGRRPSLSSTCSNGIKLP